MVLTWTCVECHHLAAVAAGELEVCDTADIQCGRRFILFAERNIVEILH